MRRLTFCIIVLFMCTVLHGQEYLHKDYYGQGESRKQALDMLMDQISGAVDLDYPAVLSTYRADISRLCLEQNRSVQISLSITGQALDRVFQARQDRTSSILEEGRRVSDSAIRKVYYTWAWYYLSSLPAAHRIPGKEDIRQWLLNHSDITPAVPPVPMTHIEREVASIRAVVGDLYLTTKPVSAPEVSILTPKTQELVRDTLTIQPVGGFLDRPSLPISLDGQVVQKQDDCFAAGSAAALSPSPGHYYVMLSLGSMPELSYGAVAGYHKKWGALVSFHSNFSQSRSSYYAYSDGTIEGGGYVWPDGSSGVDILSVTAGGSYAFIPWLHGFASAGYGHRLIDWKDTDGQWARIRDLSSRGLAVSAGVLFEWKHLAANVAVSTIAFQSLGVSVSIGYSFY